MVDIINIPDGDIFWGQKMRTNLLNLKAAAEGFELPEGQKYVVADSATGTLSADVLARLDQRFTTMEAVAAQFTSYLPSPGSDVDIAPYIQALYDSGKTHITLSRGQTYYFNSIVFRDSPDVRNTLTIDQNGARINCGPQAGAKASDWTGDSSTRFLFFGNSKRTGYNASTNTVTTGESATSTGSFTATVGLGIQILNLDIRGTNQPIRVAHLSNTTGYMTGRISNMLGAVGSRSYCDSNYIQVRHTNPYTGSAEAPSLINQKGNGDNLVIIGNADSRALICDLTNCRGATILAPVGGGMRFVDCYAINVIGGHIEGDEHLRSSPVLTVTRSQVRVVGTEIWSANTVRDNGLPAIQTIDLRDGTSTPDASTELTLDGVLSRAVYRIADSGGSVVDEAQMPDLQITSINAGSRVVARGYSAAVTQSNLPGVSRVMPRVTSSIAAVQTALDAGAALIASGYWELMQVSSTWRVVPFGRSLIQETPARTAAPTVEFASQYTAIPGAVTGGTYNYYFAEIDELGMMGPRTLASNVVVSAISTTVRIGLVLRRPGRVAIWRQVEGGPIDRYIAVGSDVSRFFVYDTGTNVNKRPWITSGFPERPASNTTSTSVNALTWNGRAITTT